MTPPNAICNPRSTPVRFFDGRAAIRHAMARWAWAVATFLVSWLLFPGEVIAERLTTRATSWMWVETDDGRALIVDADARRIAHSLVVPGTVIGRPQPSADGSGVLLATADGRVRVEPLVDDAPARERRLAPRPRTAAASADGRWLLVAIDNPPSLLLLDAQLRDVKTFVTASRDGKRRGAAAAVIDLPRRRSWAVTLPAIDELWEISYDEKAEPIYDGLVHDFRMGEGVPIPGFLNPRRRRIAGLPDAIVADAEEAQLLGPLGKPDAADGLQLINLDVGRQVGRWPDVRAAAPLHAVAWAHAGQSRMAVTAAPLAAANEPPPPPGMLLLDTAAWPARAGRWLPSAAGGWSATSPLSPWLWLAGLGADGSPALSRFDAAGLPLPGLPLDGLPTAAPVADARGCRMMVPTAGTPPAIQVFDSRTARPLGRIELPRPALRLVALMAPTDLRQDGADGC